MPVHSNLRTVSDDLVVGMNEDTNQIVLFEDNLAESAVQLPSSFMDAHKSMVVRADLSDTGVYICSPDVLARFSDEFDYRSIGKKFICNSVAEEEEGLQNRIFAHVLDSKR